jgi:hypothetical protein
MFSLRFHQSAFISVGMHILLVFFVAKAIGNIDIKKPGQAPSIFLKVTKEASNKTSFSVDRGRQEFKQAPSALPTVKANDEQPDLSTKSVANELPAIESRPSPAVREPEALGTIADPSQFTIAMPEANPNGDMGIGPIGSRSPNSSWGKLSPPIGSSAANPHAERELKQQKMQAAQRKDMFLAKYLQRQTELRRSGQDVSCKIRIDEGFVFAQMVCKNASDQAREMGFLQGPVTFVNQVNAPSQCWMLGNTQEDHRCP